MTTPPYLSICDPETRLFPLDWRREYFCLPSGVEDGYTSPSCGRRFFGPGPDGFEELHGDHRIPWSKGGRTTWENLQLLCGSCNLSKSDRSPSPMFIGRPARVV